MNRRIRLIFWLLTGCVLGINGFQAYWLYATTQLTTAEYDRTIREALVTTVQEQLIAGIDQLRTQGVELILLNSDTARRGVHGLTVYPGVHAPDGLTVIPVGVEHREAVSIAHQLAHLTLDDWRSGLLIDPAYLTRVYRAELLRRGINAAANLDTFTVKAGGRPPQRVEQVGFMRQTPPVLLNPARGLYVRAFVPKPNKYLWLHLRGLLGGSVLLLVLTTGCFVLVWQTTLAQRRLADAKNDFINNMTHELKTPLTTVSAAVDALQYFGALDDPHMTQVCLNISRTELQRLATLVDKVLTSAASEGQALAINPELLAPAELVQEAVERHRLQALKPICFVVDMAPGDTLLADRLHLTGVLNNLLDNAVKYSHAEVAITFRSRREATGWYLTVQDDGLGIPKGYQEAIFDRFFRVPTGNLHPVKGFGLGLHYVRQVVERHGGHIRVRSELGRGSAFTLWLPLTPTVI